MNKQFQSPPNPQDMRNMVIAGILCFALIYCWQVFYQQPRAAARLGVQQEQQANTARMQAALAAKDGSSPDTRDALPSNATAVNAAKQGISSDEISTLPRDQLIAASPRVKINSPALHGSINLDGLRFDDLTLIRHRVEVDPNSPEVVLLTPAQSASRYFIQLGWLPSKGDTTTLPNNTTRWQADGDTLSPGNPVTLNWTNPQGVAFRVTVAVDEDYLFTLKQEVTNQSGVAVNVMPYGLINHALPAGDRYTQVIHQGPIAVMDNQLVEVNYAHLKEDGKKSYADAKGWLGVADKYWLTAFMPPQDSTFNANFQFVAPNGHERTQVDFLAPNLAVAPGATASYALHMFAGAKELPVLDKYRDSLNLPLFDRALDFGIFYFLTRPIFQTLDFFYGILGNFGLSIMLMVVVLKLILFPLTNKSYRSMAQMRTLQPKIEQIRKDAGDDKVKAQQEIMKLWQKEKINPVSGCFPILIQIPIFFSLYKVLMVSIEMRHAPFYGWIHDLSAPDYTNIFTLFGILEWPAPAILHIGAWPVIMALTMFFQQKMSPPPSDPVQAKVISFLPLIFLFLFSSFPAGLLIYWAWNNTLSIGQQAIINRNYERHKRKKSARQPAADNEA